MGEQLDAKTDNILKLKVTDQDRILSSLEIGFVTFNRSQALLAIAAIDSD